MALIKVTNAIRDVAKRSMSNSMVDGTQSTGRNNTYEKTCVALLPHRRVLIADDNVDAAQSLALIVRIWGYQVQTSDGLTTVDVCDSFSPDVAILDICMPGKTGLELAQWFRTTRGSTVRLIALTAYGDIEARSRTKQAGFDHHEVKPGDLSTIRTWLAAA